MTQVTRFGTTQALLTYRLGYNPADLAQQIETDYHPDLATQQSTVIEVARQVDVVSPVSDLALGITPTAFGPSPAWTNVANLTDGDGTTTFASGPNYVQGGGVGVDKGFSIDLGAPASVSEIQLKVTPYSPATNYHWESSPDGTTWTDRPYTRTGPVASVYTYTLTGGPFTFRYWRLRRSYLGYIGPQRVYTWAIPGSTTTSSVKTWFGTTLVNDFDDTTYEASDGVDEFVRVLFDIDERIARARLLVGSEFAGSVTYSIQHATELDFSDAVTDATVTISATGGYTGDEVMFAWEPDAAYSLWQIVSSADENRRVYTLEMYEGSIGSEGLADVLAIGNTADGFPILGGAGQALELGGGDQDPFNESASLSLGAGSPSTTGEAHLAGGFGDPGVAGGQVFAEGGAGNDGDGDGASLTLAGGGATGDGGAGTLAGGEGHTAGDDGGDVTIDGGAGTQGTTGDTAGAEILIEGGKGDGTVGRVGITSDGSSGTAGQVWTADGTGTATWEDATGGGSALTVKDEGSTLDTAVTSIDFVGSAVVATNIGHAVTVTISAGSTLTVKDEGSNLDTAVTSIDFVGPVQATAVGHAITVTITGGTPSGGYGTPAAGTSGSVLRADAVLPKPTAADVDFSADVTTNNVTTGHHGLAPKLDGNASHYMDGTGAFTTPPGTPGLDGALIYLAHQIR